MTAELNCNSCKKRVLLDTMRYSKDGAGLICDDCWNKQHHGVNLKVKPQTFTRLADTVQKKKVDYFCKTCSYRFSRALDFGGPKLCPSCGKGNIMYNLPNDADELLRELDRMDDV